MLGSLGYSRDARFRGNGVEVSIMEHDRSGWRFHLNTLMLLVVIVALATYIVVERWPEVQEKRRLAAAHDRAARQAQAQAQRIRAQARSASSAAQVGTTPTVDK